MSSEAPSTTLLTCGIEDDRTFEREDFEGPVARWCPGCGDHAILGGVLRLFAEEQLQPEDTVIVSGIGCSSRFPHYVKTYGFHGIHGRALPLATGVKLARPDLHVFAVMGDGDCCSIGAAHWIHALRYNVNMVALLLDNNIYGLTKKQTSPTTPQGYPSNTQPHGSYLPALNPLTTTLGVTNISFVAQTADWVPGHLFATLKAAYHHPGFSFVRILQRCPIWTADIFQKAAQNPDDTQILVHERGIHDEDTSSIYKNQLDHDPRDIHRGRELAEEQGVVRLGLFFCDPTRPRYDETRRLPVHTAEDRIEILNEELDHHAV
ncbi:MAG: thiamine pyrophosphate-dependent enzyme [Planctomycetota bacterium]